MARDIRKLHRKATDYPSPLQLTGSSHDALTTLQASQTLPNRNIVGRGGLIMYNEQLTQSLMRQCFQKDGIQGVYS